MTDTTLEGSDAAPAVALEQAYDKMYGPVREPAHLQEWEQGVAPVSKVKLDPEIGRKLLEYRNLASCELFHSASQCFLFLWAMDEHADVWIAFEEIIPSSGDAVLSGYPRRRGFPSHPAEEKKLGHPTLVDGRGARVAGELYLDKEEGVDCLTWLVNVGSGRYCREFPPGPEQCKAVLNFFRVLIDESVQWDELE